MMRTKKGPRALRTPGPMSRAHHENICIVSYKKKKYKGVR